MELEKQQRGERVKFNLMFMAFELLNQNYIMIPRFRFFQLLQFYANPT